MLVSSLYLGPIGYYALLSTSDTIYIEQHEHFHKQTYRNRANIYGPNGLQSMIIPVRYKNHTPMKDVQIAYDFDWQKQHWRTLESAYRNSPYFEFYESDLSLFYKKRFTLLIEFNEAIHKKILELLEIKTNIQYTSSYIAHPPQLQDFRETFHPKKDVAPSPKVEGWGEDFYLKPYSQVFENKFGFLPNLSIIDLLFNQGPHASEYLLHCK